MGKKAGDVLFEEGIRIQMLAPCDHYAGKESFIRKAFEIQQKTGPLFDITCDLEDGAANGDEVAAAKCISRLISSDLNVFEACGVRIHPPSSGVWEKELDILLEHSGGHLSYITVPKVFTPDEVFLVHHHIEESRRRFSIEREILLHVLIETQSALQHVFDIASLPGLRCLDFGLMDFISGHAGVIPFDAARSPGQFDHALIRRAKTLTVAAASSAGLTASHNVTVQYQDLEATERDAFRARHEFGFLRMWSIHPSQIEPVIRAMSPSFTDLKKAVALLEKARSEDWGPVSYEGDLHDRGSYRYYWQLLQRARRFGIQLPDGADEVL